MNLPAYKNLYDFAALEIAVQQLFAAQEIFEAPLDEFSDGREEWQPEDGNVAFFTAFQAAIFQKARPRLTCMLNGIQPATNPPKVAVDNNGALRCNLWRGTLSFELVTEPNYTRHTSLRATVIALCEMLAPMVANSQTAIGVNQYLETFRVLRASVGSLDTTIAIGDGYYASTLTYDITFTIPAPAITGIVE